MIKLFVKNNIVLITIILFLFLFSLLIISKPAFIFNKDGSLKIFGLGYKNKTVLPIWLSAIILAIISYFIILYYLSFSKLHQF